MCRVAIGINRDGHIARIRTQHCGNQPACATLTGEIHRPIERPAARMLARAGSSKLGRQATKILTRLSTSSGSSGGRRRAAAAGEGEGEGVLARQARRILSLPSTLRKGLAKVASMVPRIDEPHYVPFASHFCILISFVNRCGHAVNLDPPPQGRACSRRWCRHKTPTHTITVPLDTPCTWSEECTVRMAARRAALSEITRDAQNNITMTLVFEEHKIS